MHDANYVTVSGRSTAVSAGRDGINTNVVVQMPEQRVRSGTILAWLLVVLLVVMQLHITASISDMQDMMEKVRQNGQIIWVVPPGETMH